MNATTNAGLTWAEIKAKGDRAGFRNAMPTGSDVRLSFKGDSGRVLTMHVTVIEHDRDAVYVGNHPAMLCVPYSRIVNVGKVRSESDTCPAGTVGCAAAHDGTDDECESF